MSEEGNIQVKVLDEDFTLGYSVEYLLNKPDLYVVRGIKYGHRKEILDELNELPFIIRPSIIFAGREAKQTKRQSRDVLFLSDVSDGYRYSGQKTPVLPLSTCPLVEDIMNDLNEKLSVNFNGP